MMDSNRGNWGVMKSEAELFDNRNGLYFLGNPNRRLAVKGLRIVLLVAAIAWIALLALVALGFFSTIQLMPENAEQNIGSVSFALYGATLLEGILVMGILLGTIRSLGSLARKQSPFCLKQVRSIRILSVLLFCYGVVDSFVGTHFFAFAGVGASSLGFSIPFTIAFDRPWWIPEVNAGIFIAAIVVLAISYVFEFGCELQEESEAFL